MTQLSNYSHCLGAWHKFIFVCRALWHSLQALYEMLSRSELKALADEAFGKEDALKEVTKSVAKAWKAVKDGYAPNTIPDQV